MEGWVANSERDGGISLEGWVAKSKRDGWQSLRGTRG
jgi:hypothetical protein